MWPSCSGVDCIYARKGCGTWCRCVADVPEQSMSFEAYLRSIKARTGKTPRELRDLAIKAGVFKPTMCAAELITWLAQEFQLGHGHSMAVWAVFKSKGWVRASKK